MLKTGGTDGSIGYIKFGTVTVTGIYADHPFYIRLHSRGLTFDVIFNLEGLDNVRAIVGNAIVNVHNRYPKTIPVKVFYDKTSEIEIDFYYLKNQAYDHLFAEDFMYADDYEGRKAKFEFKSEFTTTLPEGAVLIPTKADPDEIAADVAEIQTSLNTVSTNLTLGSDVSAGTIIAKRVSNIVNVIGIGIKPLVSNTECTLATLDFAFRPSTMNVTGWCSFDSGSIASETFVRVTTNGTISINRQNAGLDTSLGYSFSITYII